MDLTVSDAPVTDGTVLFRQMKRHRASLKDNRLLHLGSMPNIWTSLKSSTESARQFLDRQAAVAVWYTEYQSRSEVIGYANNVFSQTFDISIEQILAAKRYHLVNPQDTPKHVIEQYKDEDLAAIRDGCFFARNPLEQSQSIEVVKLRFDQGMLGLFKILDTEPADTPIGLKDFDRAILAIVHHVRPDLLLESRG
jgi:hypothetical protein